jgi:hypothetical protein
MISVGVLIVLVIVIYGSLFGMIKTADFTTSSPALTAIRTQAETIGQKAKAGGIPWRKVDLSGFDSDPSAKEILETKGAVDEFELRQHRLPANSAELLSSLELVERNSGAAERIARDCQVVVLKEDSYILNCDGWSKPEPSQLTQILSSFEEETEKFYRIHDHTLLYEPPLSTGKPPVSGTVADHKSS